MLANEKCHSYITNTSTGVLALPDAVCSAMWSKILNFHQSRFLLGWNYVTSVLSIPSETFTNIQHFLTMHFLCPNWTLGSFDNECWEWLCMSMQLPFGGVFLGEIMTSPRLLPLLRWFSRSHKFPHASWSELRAKRTCHSNCRISDGLVVNDIGNSAVSNWV